MKIFSLIIDFYERAIIDGYEAMMQNRRLKNVRGEYVVIQYIRNLWSLSMVREKTENLGITSLNRLCLYQIPRFKILKRSLKL